MAKKHLGQNFLFDPSILKRMIEVSGIDDSDVVLEIGPGHGRLTELISQKARSVIAIEIDEYFVDKLKDKHKDNGNVEIIHGDALKYPYETIKDDFKVVSNIPYYITTPILFRLFEVGSKIKSMTITMQREVAERIVADNKRGDYGLLSVAVRYYGKAEIKFLIPKGAFRPSPKVDSAVVKIDIHPNPVVDVGDKDIFFKVIRAGFGQRRKTLYNCLKTLYPDIKETLSTIGIDHMRRAETLSIEEFSRISLELTKHRIQNNT
ncbi:MAG: 16S rRNA (adenine(1518)-N(6)/adenine(1519)-N(6))-dimethyltransferase RsmA [Thermodesulfovibrionales bacterium]|nr:16S rRNA (adenine(1518)-N(6)/adenine(1519)-N(6))-dimethyltransferase RsmA [Thermodesulfovibrionales bacterium]